MILDQILSHKRKELAQSKQERPLETIKKKLSESRPAIRSLSAELQKKNKQPHLICEMKKASPSEGLLKEPFLPEQILFEFEKAGASAISVLTETKYFLGNAKIIQDLKPMGVKPILRKDFIVDEYQVYESRFIGADAILLIVSILTDEKLKNLYDLATELGLEVLVEIHDPLELERAFALHPKMIGINNRNLDTLQINLDHSLQLIRQIPAKVLKVVESGISSHKDILKYQSGPVDGFLIGTVLMKSNNITQTIYELKNGYPS